MGPMTRAVPSLLLAGGIVVLFAGLTAALGGGLTGTVASAAAIAALLYAGALWFGGSSGALAAPAGETVIVFDRTLRVSAGLGQGSSILLQFPAPLRPEIDLRCRLALAGQHTHFECEHAGARLSFDIAPVQTICGVVVYGVVMSGAGIPAAAAAQVSATLRTAEIPAADQERLSSVRSCITCAAQSRALVSMSSRSASADAPDFKAAAFADWRAASAASGS